MARAGLVFQVCALLLLAATASTGATAMKGTPVESVITLLEKLHVQIQGEGKKEAASYDKFACFCKEQADEKFYTITKAKKKIERLTAEMEQLEGEIESLEAEEAEAKKEKEKNEKEIAAKKEARAKELEEFQKMDGNLRTIITALKDAIKALEESKEKMVGDAKLSLLKEVLLHHYASDRQRPARVVQFLQVLKGTEKSEEKRQEPGAAAYAYKSNDVIAMLKEMVKDFTGDKREGVSEEQRNKHDSDMTVNGLENVNEGLAALLAKNREIQGAKNDALSAKEQDKQETETNLGYDQDFLDELTEQCETKASEFDQRSKARADELTAITGALELLKGTVQGKYEANKKLVGLVTKHAARTHGSGSGSGKHGHWVWKHVFVPDPAPTGKAGAESGQAALTQDLKSAESSEDDDDEDESDQDEDEDEDEDDDEDDSAAESFLQRRKRNRSPRRSARSKKALKFLAGKAEGLNSPLLSTLVMKLRRSGADHFVKVRGLILDLVKKLEEDAQNEADHKAWCDEELESAITSRDEQQQAIEKENGEITKGKAKIHKLNGEIADISQDIADLNKAKKEAEELRQEEKHENKYTVEEAKAGLGAVTRAIEILKGFYENAFLQQKYDPFRAEGAGADGKTVGDMAPDAGFEGEYQGNQGASKGIIGMLEVIKSDFERTIKTTEDAEEDAEAKHDTFLEETDADIKSKDEEKDTKEGEKKDEEADLTNNKDELLDATDMKKQALNELEKLKPACIDTGLSWEERTKKREQEIEALKEALNILDTAFE